MHYLPKELKVCEGCGTLWVRTNAADGVYCRSCAAKLREFPAPRGKRGGGRKKRVRSVEYISGPTAQAEMKGGAR